MGDVFQFLHFLVGCRGLEDFFHHISAGFAGGLGLSLRTTHLAVRETTVVICDGYPVALLKGCRAKYGRWVKIDAGVDALDPCFYSNRFVTSPTI